MENSPNRLTLPSGAWAEFRTSVKYGARHELQRLGYKISATASVSRGATEANFSMAADELAAAGLADEYYPLVYMLAAWSFDAPLPTMDDLSSLDDLDIEDGEMLVEKAKEAYASKGQVDFSPNMDETRTSPTTPSDGSSRPSGGNGLTNGTASQQKSSSTRS